MKQVWLLTNPGIFLSTSVHTGTSDFFNKTRIYATHKILKLCYNYPKSISPEIPRWNKRGEISNYWSRTICSMVQSRKPEQYRMCAASQDLWGWAQGITIRIGAKVNSLLSFLVLNHLESHFSSNWQFPNIFWNNLLFDFHDSWSHFSPNPFATPLQLLCCLPPLSSKCRMPLLFPSELSCWLTPSRLLV